MYHPQQYRLPKVIPQQTPLSFEDSAWAFQREEDVEDDIKDDWDTTKSEELEIDD